MSSLGIIFSSIHNETIEELTSKRTSGSIPFGGKYRIIDFVLSSFVSANIYNVGVLTHKNYQSLMDHIGSGRDWDMARKNGGLIVFPPFSNYHADSLYETRLEALYSIENFINKRMEEYVILTDCDSVNMIDFEDVIKAHKANKADVTIVYKHGIVTDDLKEKTSLELTKDNKVKGGTLHSTIGAVADTAINVWVINRSKLIELLIDAKIKGYTSFNRDVIFKNIKTLKVFGYNYQGIYLHLNNMENYFKCNMELLKEDARNELFGNPDHRIYTKVRDSAPTRYGNDCTVENSFIADGCVIEGTVVNSILFRGVKVEKHALVENSIIMQDTTIGKNSEIKYVVADKNVKISANNELTGCAKVPYYIAKSKNI